MAQSRQRLIRERFPRGVAEELGWYVYVLADPRSDPPAVFYVGKGLGDRVHAHVWEALGGDAATLKLDQIRAVHDAGLAVRVEILRHNLPSEEIAYEAEAAAIDAFRVAGADLTNAVGGHHSTARGHRPLGELVEKYAARPAVVPADLHAVLFRLRRSWYRGMPDDLLYEKTRGWWGMGPKRERVQVAFAVAGGIVRAAYRVTPGSWVNDGSRRWQWAGARDEDLDARYLGASVADRLPDGARFEFRYLFD
jgi:uncharacterized protein